MGAPLADRARTLYESGQFDALIASAEQHWPAAPDGSIEAGAGELFRFASVAAWDRLKAAQAAGDDEASLVELAGEVEVLRTRAQVAAVLLDDRATAAGMLLPAFFALTDRGSHARAREVLDAIPLLVPGHFTSDPPGVFARLFSEKRAYSFLVEGRYAEAEAAYVEALARSVQGSRGRLKVSGALALTRFLQRPHDADQPAREMEDVRAAAARGGFPDVVRAAAANLALVREGRVEGWVAFEIT